VNTQDVTVPRAVLHAVLHAVLFHRPFGLVEPKTINVLDATMSGVDNADMDRLVGEKVGVFWRAVEDSPDKRGQVRANA
jgi:autophagy-related protein 101